MYDDKDSNKSSLTLYMEAEKLYQERHTVCKGDGMAILLCWAI
jgi:hypothetical protein